MVVHLSNKDSFAIGTNGAFGCGSLASIYSNLEDASVDIMCASGQGPISKWVDDHIFIRILQEFIPGYNNLHREWKCQIAIFSGKHHVGGWIWYEGDLLPNVHIAEFDDDMSFPVQDLSSQSVRSPEDLCFSRNLDDIDAISDELGIPWQKEKDLPFSHEFPFMGFIWNICNEMVSLPLPKREKYLVALREWWRLRLHTLQASGKPPPCIKL